jgi:hypothetical protein
MPNGHFAGYAFNVTIAKRLRNQTHSSVDTDFFSVRRRHAGRLLAPMLQSEQPDGSEGRAVRSRSKHTDHATLFARVVKWGLG